MSTPGLDAIGWAATAVFASSYLQREPAALRRVQALGAALWIIYGLRLGARPVVVANLIVAGAALWSTLSRRRHPRPAEPPAPPDLPPC